MRKAFAFSLVVTLPGIAFGQELSFAGPVSNYRILSLNADGQVLVYQESQHFLCNLDDQQNVVELIECKEILSPAEIATRVTQFGSQATVERLRAINDDDAEKAILALFSIAECELNLGRDPEFEATVPPADWLLPPTDGNGFVDTVAQPLQATASIDDVNVRAETVRKFGANLGFNQEDTEVIVDRLYRRFDWTLKSLVQQNILVEVRLGHFELNKGCE